MAAGGQAGGMLAPRPPDILSLAISMLPRQTPEAGAVREFRTCGSVRGRSVMDLTPDTKAIKIAKQRWHDLAKERDR